MATVCAAFLLLGAMLLPAADRDRRGVLFLLQVPGVVIVGLMLDCLFPLAVPVRLLLAWVGLHPVARLAPYPRLRAAVAVLLVPAVYMAAGGAALWVWVSGLVALELRRFRGILSLGAVAAIGCLAALLVWAGYPALAVPHRVVRCLVAPRPAPALLRLVPAGRRAPSVVRLAPRGPAGQPMAAATRQNDARERWAGLAGPG